MFSYTIPSQPQEVFRPVVARLRAFSWLDKNVGGPQKPFSETDAEMLEFIADYEIKIRKGKERQRTYHRFQGELQRRYIRQLAGDIPDWGAWGGPVCIFDTETQNVETGQAMRFGVAQMRGYAYHEQHQFRALEGRWRNRSELDELREVYIFYDPDMLELDPEASRWSVELLDEVRRSRENASGVPHYLTTRDQFVEDVLFRNDIIKGAIPIPTLVIGHNLAFDLERLPVFNATKALGDFFHGGFSLPMGRSIAEKGNNKGHPDGQRVQLKKIGPGKNNYQAVSNDNAHIVTHQFVDTLMLAKALLGADTPGGMDALCEMFGGPLPKENVDHFKPLIREYVEYGYNDVERTWFIYTKLRDLYLQHGRSTPIWSMYSVASVGKAYYKDFRIETFLSKNVKGPSSSKLKALKLCGVSMEAMVGARAECGVRHQIREIINKDFKSQYPTINIKLGLQDLLLAERVGIDEDERLKSGDWLRGGGDAKFLEGVSILDIADRDAVTADRAFVFGADALLGKDKMRSDKVWRRLLGFALVDPTEAILPLRTAFQDDNDKDDGKASINVGLTEIESGPPIWVTYLDVLASKFLTGKMPRILRTMRMVPIGRQSNLTKIGFFGDDRYVIDLASPDVDIFKRILEMRDEIKMKMGSVDVAKGSSEYNRLNAMQLALKLIANSTSYGVFVQFDVDERSKPTPVSVFHGVEEKKIVARQKTRTDDGSKETSSIKVEKPGAWFAPWGPLITAGGRMLIAIAEMLALHEGREHGGIPYGMCDTDSMAFVRPETMPRTEFRAAVERIGDYFQRINPYAPVGGKETEVFATEDINFAFANEGGRFKIIKPKQMKPLYILSVSAKRYAMANITRADGSDYDSLGELHADWRNVVVILRKVSAHGLGPITAPGYKRPPDDGVHLAVPFKYGDDGRLVLKFDKDSNGDRPVPLYGEVCKGKGNARLFLDMWKYAFEAFIRHEGRRPGREISHMIEAEMPKWHGLDQPQFKQRSLNTWSQFKQYEGLRNRRAGMFFNVLPAPEVQDEGAVDYAFEIDQYDGKSLYCQGGSDIDAAKLLVDGQVWWQFDNMPASNFVGPDRPYRLQTVAEAIGDYFNRPEFKSKGEYGGLERHRVIVSQREYVGKETNDLLDPDLPDNDETQIEDAAAQPYFRRGFNPVLAAQYLNISGIADTLDVASPDALKEILNGYAPSVHATRVLAWLRKGTRYDEMTGLCMFDGAIREADLAEREAAQLVDLARRSYRKMAAECRATAQNALFPGAKSGKKPIVEIAIRFGLVSGRRPHSVGPFASARQYEKADEELAHYLINPLLYFDRAANAIKQGAVKARTGQELKVEDAVALFEDYLGIARRKEQVAAKVKTLHDGRRDRRAARRLQSKKMLMRAVSKMQFATLDNCVRMLKSQAVEEFGYDPVEVEKASTIIEAWAVISILIDPDFQMLFRKHTQTRKARPDVKRFVQDLLDRMTEHDERRRARKRINMRRSRLEQSSQMRDGGVQVDLGNGDRLNELHA